MNNLLPILNADGTKRIVTIMDGNNETNLHFTAVHFDTLELSRMYAQPDVLRAEEMMRKLSPALLDLIYAAIPMLLGGSIIEVTRVEPPTKE